MVVSASRRTDIPSHYSDWFFRRLQEGYAVTRNPMNPGQVKRVSLLRSDVDCFVFWTKNPEPMLARLGELSEYPYYFQFTLNAYANDAERNLPPKTELIDTFRRLSDLIGPERVLWRYDPIFLSERYSLGYHIHYFGALARRLNGYTSTVTISFIDLYPKLKNRFVTRELTLHEQEEIARGFSQTAREHRLSLVTCSEQVDLSGFGIQHARCIDAERIERLSGKPIAARKDSNQRPACGCASSVDIGAYNTCRNGCIYCYANHSDASIQANVRRHDPHSPELLARSPS